MKNLHSSCLCHSFAFTLRDQRKSCLLQVTLICHLFEAHEACFLLVIDGRLFFTILISNFLFHLNRAIHACYAKNANLVSFLSKVVWQSITAFPKFCSGLAVFTSTGVMLCLIGIQVLFSSIYLQRVRFHNFHPSKENSKYLAYQMVVHLILSTISKAILIQSNDQLIRSIP